MDSMELLCTDNFKATDLICCISVISILLTLAIGFNQEIYKKSECSGSQEN